MISPEIRETRNIRMHFHMQKELIETCVEELMIETCLQRETENTSSLKYKATPSSVTLKTSQLTKISIHI